MTNNLVAVRAIVYQWLTDHGYTGLCNPEPEDEGCGCGLEDLFCCESCDPDHCFAAYENPPDDTGFSFYTLRRPE